MPPASFDVLEYFCFCYSIVYMFAAVVIVATAEHTAAVTSTSTRCQQQRADPRRRPAFVDRAPLCRSRRSPICCSSHPMEAELDSDNHFCRSQDIKIRHQTLKPKPTVGSLATDSSANRTVVTIGHQRSAAVSEHGYLGLRVRYQA